MRARLRTRRGLATLAAGILVVAVAGFAVAYVVVFPTSSPERFALTTFATAAKAGTAAPGAGATDSAQGSGRWAIASGSKAGYRVREKLAFLPAENDAVGRTSAISGDATLAGSGEALTVKAASFKIDLTTLTSDRSMRDERIREIGIESARYPTATFKLGQPIVLPAGARDGEVVKAAATGVLTLHGAAEKETIPLQLTVGDGTLQAVGSLTFPWDEFGMTAPSVAGFVSVEDEATMEFDLRFARA